MAGCGDSAGPNSSAGDTGDFGDTGNSSNSSRADESGDDASDQGSTLGNGDGDGDDDSGDGDGDGDGDDDSGDGDGDSGNDTLGNDTSGDGDGDPGDGDGDSGDGDGDSGDGDGDSGDGDGDSGDGDGDSGDGDSGDGDSGDGDGDGDGDGNSGACLAPYHVLDLPDRNKAFNDGDGNVEWCDRLIGNMNGPQWQGEGWYRLSGAAGQTIPLAPPISHSCGAEAPGWMVGALPQFGDGAVARTVCFSWANDSCQWQTQVEVVNCGGFYLYHLPNVPTCALRYCGE